MALLGLLLAGCQPKAGPADDPPPADDTGGKADVRPATRWTGDVAPEDVQVIAGVGPDDLAGEAVAGVGDLDGDGFDDVLVGGFQYPGDGSSRGAVWVLPGPLDDRATLADAAARIDGDERGFLGDTLVAAGDVNRDGFDDFLVGAPGGGDVQAGVAYLFHGPVPADATLADAYGTLQSPQGGAHFGRSIAVLDDRDGDGAPEIAVGANGWDGDGHDAAGAVYVVEGELVRGDTDLSRAAEIGGDENDGLFGTTVADVGDLDGDGLDDLGASAYLADEGGVDDGVVYLFAGPFAGKMTVADADARLVGDAGETGRGLARLGDVDDDGYVDLAVGAPAASFVVDRGGAAYWLRGPFSGARSTREAEGRVDGLDEIGTVGEAVLGPGDLDGDGVPDLLVAAPLTRQGDLESAGAVYLFYDLPRGVVTTDDADARLRGDSEGLGLGHTLALAGDTDADGVPELLVGTQANEESSVLGGVWVARGQP